MQSNTYRNPYKNKESYLNRKGKRRLTTVEEVKHDLNKDLVKLFNCFTNAIEIYNKDYAKVPPGMMIRNYSAVTFNQCLVSSAFKNFYNKCFFGKYKRFYISIEGYTIQFKKLNGKGVPMNIKTGNVKDISSQTALDLFGDAQSYNPILFFGYKTDKLGNFVSPQIVYIDEGQIKFVITEENISNFNFQEFEREENKDNNDVKLRVNSKLKKAN